jgi:hypothetical protein
MISRDTLNRIRTDLASVPWEDEDIDGLITLLEYWFPLFSELDEADVAGFPPEGLGPVRAEP